MARMCSSALGDRREKWSNASKRIAAGDVDPGLNTDRVVAMARVSADTKSVAG